jgi:serine phosphatase RsbU (regulator of sigma subunit)
VSVPTQAGVPTPRDPALSPQESSGLESTSLDPVRFAWLGDPETILLVEDDAGDVLLVGELLADSGVEASLSAVRSLAEATDLLSQGLIPGCVLLDLHLPDVHGLDAVTQMLAAAPGAPVVVLTGLAEESAGLAAVAAGAQDYLIKGQAPPDVFGRAIRYATQRKHVELATAALQRSALQAAENARLERALLPTPLIRTEAFDMVARYRPGRANTLLGGDFYDVVETSDGTVHAVIGDVCGHGAAEAAIGVCLRVAWRSLVLAGAAPPALMGLLEQLLMAERDDDHLFATLTHLVFDPDRRSVRVLRAGHPGLLLRTPGHVELVEGPAGPAVGLDSGQHWQEEHLLLSTDAGLVLFTDGLFEGRVGPGNQRLGEEGLLAMARDLAMLPPADFVDTLLDATEAAAAPYGGLADDVALVHLGWKAAE